MLISVKTLARTLAASQGPLAILGDALGVLHDALRMRARDPILNMVIGEMALILAPRGLDTRLAHLWSERDKVCDALSRASCAEPCLPELVNARRVQRSANEYTLLQKPTP